MCVVCGCADSQEIPAHGSAHAHAGAQAHGHGHPHVHPHVQVDARHGDLHFGAGAARVSVPGMSQSRAIRLEADILGVNNHVAAQNRRHFEAHGVTALNLVSSPGSGKTTLLCATIDALRQRHADWDVAVIEGDQQTSFDADRIRATGAPAVQVNTGKGCHLDAPMVAEAFGQLHRHTHHDHDTPHHHGPAAPSLLFIENVGNLVCPAMWDLGEAAKVVVLSVTEGEDKPLKYPDMFAASRLMLLNKVDLLPHLQFDVQRCIAAARQVNPGIEVIQLSATTGAGMAQWLDWLAALAAPAVAPPEAALHARIAELERALAEAQRVAQP